MTLEQLLIAAVGAIVGAVTAIAALFRYFKKRPRA